MELDTGASRSIISERTYEQLRKNGAPSLESYVIKLRTYTGEQLSVLGTLSVPVTYQDQHIKDLDLLVVKGDGPNLFGQNWLDRVRLDWSNIYKIQSESQSRLQSILQGFQSLFGEDLGEARNVSAKIYVAKDEKPRFYCPRRVPYSLKNKVEEELDRLEKQGVIEPCQFSNWAAPIVPVLKQEGSIRICGDYKLTVNRVAKLDTYPLPRITDLFASLAGGTLFSKLDLTQAYQHPQRLVYVQTVAIWSSISTWNLPEDD